MAISDKDLDRMTKPVDDRGPDFRFTEGELLYPPEVIDDRGPDFRFTEEELMAPAGISSMQETPFDNFPGAKALVNYIRAGLSNPEQAMSEGATPEDVAMAQDMTDNQLLEFVTEIAGQAEADGMGEESAEDKAIRLVTGQEGGEQTARSISDRDLMLFQETGEPSAMQRLDQLGDPRDINFAPTGLNKGGAVKYYNTGGLASLGRGGDSQLAHVMPGETMVPPGVMDDGMLDAAFVRAGLDPNEYKVGSGQNSINPITGMPEYGLGSFIKRLFKKVKKLAPAIGALVGFSYGGAKGAGIGKAIGGVIKTGDLDFTKALSDFGTGWTLGKVGEGFGLQGGEFGDFSSRKSIFKGSSAGGMWGKDPTIAMGDDAATAGGVLQNIGARIAGGEGIDLMEQFKNLPMGHKLAVGALGLNALSQTGMFDEEELGDTPPELRQGIAELRDYHSAPLRAANQVEYSFDPSLGKPIGVTQYSNQNKSLKQVLEELKSDSIGYQPSPITFG